MVSRALVTGGAGFIGSALVDRLIDDGATVLVVDSLAHGKLSRLSRARASGSMVFDQLDVRAPEMVDVAVQFHPEVVFHLAAQIDAVASVADPVVDADVNVTGTVGVLRAAVAAGAECVVYMSSGGAIYGGVDAWPVTEKVRRHPATPYGVSKSVADEYLKLFRETQGLDFVSLGPSNVYGPRQDGTGEGGVVATFVARLLEGRRPIIYGDGSQTRDFVYVEDVADACVRAAARGGGRYFNISTGVETTVLDLCERLSALTGRTLDPRFEPAREGDVARSALDATAAARQLGWEPWTPLDRGLEQTVSWFRGR